MADFREANPNCPRCRGNGWWFDTVYIEGTESISYQECNCAAPIKAAPTVDDLLKGER